MNSSEDKSLKVLLLRAVVVIVLVLLVLTGLDRLGVIVTETDAPTEAVEEMAEQLSRI